MPRLTREDLATAIEEGQAARAQKARALASAVRERGFIIDDDIRQIPLLRGQFAPFMNSVLTPLSAPTPYPVSQPAPKPKQPPLWLAALSACSISGFITLMLLTAAAMGRLL